MKTKTTTFTPTGYQIVKTVNRGNKAKVKTTTFTARPLQSRKLFNKTVTKVKTKKS